MSATIPFPSHFFHGCNSSAADSADAIVASAAGNIAASASEVAISIYNKDHRANVSATKL